jgi:hypothetical protein
MIRRFVLLASLALLVACASPQRADLTALDETLDLYASTVRWGTPDQLVGFIDPVTLKERPVREFDLERLRQLRVASFCVDPPVVYEEGRARQAGQVDLVNVNTQQMRSVLEVSEWRWDPAAQRWWLVSGLPRFDRAAR